MRKLSDILAHIFHPRRSNNHRARLLHPEALFFLVLISAGFVAVLHLFSQLSLSHKNVLGFASTITPKQVVELTNKERTRIGLNPLKLNTNLSQAAMAKGEDMFADQYWSHTAPDGTQPWAFIHQAGYEYKVAGENLARDFSNTPNMVAAWMASPTHKANMINAQYKEIGVAVIDGVLDGYETTLVVQMFGSPIQGGVAPQLEPSAQTNQPGGNKVSEQVARAEEANQETFTIQESGEAVKTQQAEVLASVLVPGGEIETPPLFTPLQLTKAFFLGVILLIIMTLAYDAFVIGHRSAMRLVGKNLAHIFLLFAVMYLVIFFKGGVIG